MPRSSLLFSARLLLLACFSSALQLPTTPSSSASLFGTGSSISAAQTSPAVPSPLPITPAAQRPPFVSAPKRGTRRGPRPPQKGRVAWTKKGLPPQSAEYAAPADIAAPPDATNATALMEHASRLLQLHRSREAEGVLAQLTRLTPDDGRVWMKLMTVQKRGKKPRKAERTIRDGIRACPTNGRLRQALADLCRERRRYGEARSHFQAAMKLEPSLASVYDSWGRMEAHLGQHTTAAQLYEKGLELQPSARLCHALGVLLDTQGLSERARAVLKRGLALPNEAANPQLLHALGMLEVRAGNHGAARGNFQMAIKESPSFTKAYLALGQLEERLGNRAAARRHYESGATTKQRNGQLGAVQLWQSWARMEQRMGRERQALRLYKRAHQLFPEDEQLLIEWAKLATEQREYKSARSLFKQLIESPTLATPYAFQCAANLEVRNEAPEAARRLFARGAALNVIDGPLKEQRMPLLHAWAVFEWREGDRRKARELFGEAEAAAGEDTGWLFQWHAQFEADVEGGGNPLLARHYYARAVNAAPLDSSAWSMWAEFEEGWGDLKRAEVLSKHAQVVETQALLEDAVGGTRRGSPLAPADLYR